MENGKWKMENFLFLNFPFSTFRFPLTEVLLELLK